MRCVLCAERWSRLQQPCQLCVECARVCWPLPTALSTAFFFSIKRVFPLTTAATKSSGLSQLFQSLKEGIRVCSHLQRALMLSRGREGFCSLADVQHPSRALQLRGSSWTVPVRATPALHGVWWKRWEGCSCLGNWRSSSCAPSQRCLCLCLPTLHT